MSEGALASALRAGAAAVVFGSVVWGCARPQPPRGGPVPETPIQVVETRPANLSIVEPFDDPVVIRFPRTLSERTTGGALQNSVVVSPESGRVDVSLHDDAVEVSMEGGFGPGEIYRIDVQPWFQDRFQNRMPASFQLFFSTGPEFEPNMVAGIVSDRLTLEAVDDIRVDAVSPEGRVVQATVSDSTGVFSFPFLPAGGYTLVAYDDTNRNGEPGFTERQDSLAVTLNEGDTLVVTDLELLAPDTTAAVLTGLSVLDSVSLSARLDDYLDPDVPLTGVQATVSTEGNAPVPVVEYLHRNEWDARQPAPAAAAAAPPDSLAAAGQPLAGGAPAPGGGVPGGGAPPPPAPGAGGQVQGPPEPSRELVIVMSRPLTAGLTYDVELSGVTNINGVPDGGGSAEVDIPLPPGL